MSTLYKELKTAYSTHGWDENRKCKDGCIIQTDQINTSQGADKIFVKKLPFFEAVIYPKWKHRVIKEFNNFADDNSVWISLTAENDVPGHYIGW